MVTKLRMNGQVAIKSHMNTKDKLKIVRFAVPAAVVGYLGNVVGVAFARNHGWQTDGGLTDAVAHANNFFDSMIATSAASLAVDTVRTPRDLPLRKALAVGGLVLGVGLGLNAVSETHLAHERPFSVMFSEDTTSDSNDFLYGSAASVLGAVAFTNAVRRREDTLQLQEVELSQPLE